MFWLLEKNKGENEKERKRDSATTFFCWSWRHVSYFLIWFNYKQFDSFKKYDRKEKERKGRRDRRKSRTEGRRKILKSLKSGNFKEPEKGSKSGHKFGNLFFSSFSTHLLNQSHWKETWPILLLDASNVFFDFSLCWILIFILIAYTYGFLFSPISLPSYIHFILLIQALQYMKTRNFSHPRPLIHEKPRSKQKQSKQKHTIPQRKSSFGSRLWHHCD